MSVFDRFKVQKEFPKDWFDISEQKLADFGAMCFLSGITQKFNQKKLSQIMFALEMPLRLGQYKIFKSNGFPRAFLTWAGLDDELEYKFAVEDTHFGSENWACGRSIWIVDMVSPFGHGAAVHEQLASQIFNGEQSGLNRLRARRDFSNDNPNRISQWHRDKEGNVKFRSFSKSEFRKKLKEKI